MALDRVDDAENVFASRQQRHDHAKDDQARPQPASVEAAAPGRTDQQREHNGDRGDQYTETNRRRHRASLPRLEACLVEADDVLELVEKALFDVLRLAADAAQLAERFLLLFGQ